MRSDTDVACAGAVPLNGNVRRALSTLNGGADWHGPVIGGSAVDWWNAVGQGYSSADGLIASDGIGWNNDWGDGHRFTPSSIRATGICSNDTNIAGNGSVPVYADAGAALSAGDGSARWDAPVVRKHPGNRRYTVASGGVFTNGVASGYCAK